MATAAPSKDRYFVPAPSVWPFLLTIGLIIFFVGVSNFLESKSFGTVPMIAGFVFGSYVIFRWFANVISESERGEYGRQVDMTYRWSMGWFIFSEVMFFAAFFGALYYARGLSLPWLAGWLPGILEHRGYSIERLTSQLTMGAEGIFGIPLGVAATFVFIFVLFGAFLEVTGAGQFFIDLAYAMTGRQRGGPAKAAVIASAGMGSISGSAIAKSRAPSTRFI